MNERSTQQQAVELLQELGLKQYEAACFVALSRLPSGTAKQISEISEVPRTRIYDAIRVLEGKGLVEVQRSNPQRFRAVPIAEAAETLRNEYEDRSNRLAETLADLDSAVPDEGNPELTHDVWALSGESSIANRTIQLVDGADSEIVLVVGHEDVLTPELVDLLQHARQRGLSVFIGTATEELRDLVRSEIPEAEVFVSGLDWLRSSPIDSQDTTTISRLVLIDREAILVSSMSGTNGGGAVTEKAVFGDGFDNGIVVIARRLMATGLGPDGKLGRFPT
ncbi:TrmB family transcriptional regulator [Natronorarus salvus]|uniref:TrmB family transcriptional regulator n=1 Tax=Natronorarus salvus TaxID=3117733 RepID=UPI002F262A03